MVTWSQLVGVALFVFVNEKHAAHVKHVSVESVKTGMQGATGEAAFFFILTAWTQCLPRVDAFDPSFLFHPSCDWFLIP